MKGMLHFVVRKAASICAATKKRILLMTTDRIEMKPNVMMGEPVIAGTRGHS
jgi:hypothetical protein